MPRILGLALLASWGCGHDLAPPSGDGDPDSRAPWSPDASESADGGMDGMGEPPPSCGTPAEGVLRDLADCTGLAGAVPAIGGNISTPVARAADGTVWVTHAAEVGDASDPTSAHVLVEVGAESCRVHELSRNGGDSSHDMPSLGVDGAGAVVAAYDMAHLSSADRPSPAYRRLEDGELAPEDGMRLWQSAEVHAYRLADGALAWAGSSRHGRLDVLELDGSWRWDAPRVAVRVDKSDEGGPAECTRDDDARGNRFIKTVFSRGADGRLHVIWGWAGGYTDDRRPDWLCGDIRHYRDDSHELFYAYSEDEGLTWHDASGARTVEAAPCRTRGECRASEDAPPGGIDFADPDFRITRMRQGQHRRLDVEPDGTVHVLFERSTFCDEDFCEERDASAPGALMYLGFRPGEPIGEPVTIAPHRHQYSAGIRVMDGALYAWSIDREDEDTFFEYVSRDGGESWEARAVRSRCTRAMAELHDPASCGMHILLQCRGGESGTSQVYLYSVVPE